MKTTTLSSLKDCSCIYSNGQSVLVAGRRLWLFSTNGSFIAQYPYITNPCSICLLPDNTAVVNGGGDKHYHHVSLTNGQVLWSVPKQGRRIYNDFDFAADDCQMVYTGFMRCNQQLYIEQLNLVEQRYMLMPITTGMNTRPLLFVDEQNILHVLQSRMLNEVNSCGGSKEVFSMLAFPAGVQRGSAFLKKRWQSFRPPFVSGSNGRYVLYQDLTVLDLETEQTFNLLENDSFPKTKCGFLSHYDKKRHYLTVSYFLSRTTIIIDCIARKRIAQYVALDDCGGIGTLVGDEFWIGTRNGIIRRTFPDFDELPPNPFFTKCPVNAETVFIYKTGDSTMS